MKTKKVVSYIRGIYYKREEWLIDDNPHSFGCNYHREDGPALTYYYKDGTIAEEKWYNKGVFLPKNRRLPMIQNSMQTKKFSIGAGKQWWKGSQPGESETDALLVMHRTG